MMMRFLLESARRACRYRGAWHARAPGEQALRSDAAVQGESDSCCSLKLASNASLVQTSTGKGEFTLQTLAAKAAAKPHSSAAEAQDVLYHHY